MASSLSPLKVNFEVHVKNREKLLKSIRQHLSQSSLPLHGFVLLQGGDEQTRYDTDHLELFRQESYFAYLFGVQEPGFYGAIDVGSGDSILFAPRLPDEYAVWMGKIKQLSHFKEHYMVTKAYFTDEIATVLPQNYQGSGKPLLFLLHGLNTDSNNYAKPAEFQGIDKFEKDLTTLHPILTECRVIKSELEIELIQYANDISSEAHIEVMRKAKVGMKEYQLESIFLHHTYMYGGCRHCSYTCICATGDNSAVLHYGHAAAPNDKTLEDGDMALLDMGAEYHFYGSDITCSYPINGKFTSDQSLIYNECAEMLGIPTEKKSSKPLLHDHRSYEMNTDDYQRSCQIPRRKGACFRDLPGVRVRPDNIVEWDPNVERIYLPSGKPLVPNYAMSFVRGTSSKPFARLWWDETVPTVVTRPEPHNQAILHPEQDRVLSIRENARLQGFPDFYKLCGEVKERYIQVGNAVAVPVARALGYSLGLAFQGVAGDGPLYTLPDKFPMHKEQVSSESSEEVAEEVA